MLSVVPSSSEGCNQLEMALSQLICQSLLDSLPLRLSTASPSWNMLCISNPAASREVAISLVVRNAEWLTTTECETIDTQMSSGAGSSALKDVLIPWTHDGQCRLEMKHVVEIKPCCGSINLDVAAGIFAVWVACAVLVRIVCEISSIWCYGNLSRSGEAANQCRRVIYRSRKRLGVAAQ